jgi:O-antigen/teichoic acid export membrane protein
MSSKLKAARGGVWFGAISFFTQGLSWAATFYVIRLLQPEDYGLMTMASFLTGYLQLFTDLGLGSAIVQRDTINDNEVNSVFWFALAAGAGMAIVAFLLSYPTAWIFGEPRIIPVTKLIGFLFVVTALTAVPSNLLTRQFELKKVALANLIGVLVSSVVSVVMALKGFGVYTLIWANIALNGTRMAMLFRAAAWRPRLHYSAREVRPYLGYGLYLSLSSASLRLFQSLDKMIVGKVFGSAQLGLYGYAMTIASMPLDKIWPIYQQVTFPLFANLQNRGKASLESYLEILPHLLLAIGPLCLGAAMVAPELVGVVLGAKWLPMVPLLQVFCVTKLFELLTAYQAVLLNATGHHQKIFRFYLGLVIVIPAAVLIAALHSFNALMIPWITIYPLFCIIWICRGLRICGISVRTYVRAVGDGLISSFGMVLALFVVRESGVLESLDSELMRLLSLVAIGLVAFFFVLAVFRRKLLAQAARVLLSRDA